jgi:hypothetical protein
MYLTVRRYEGVTDPKEVGRRVKEGFAPLVSRPGSAAYGLDTKVRRRRYRLLLCAALPGGMIKPGRHAALPSNGYGGKIVHPTHRSRC